MSGRILGPIRLLRDEYIQAHLTLLGLALAPVPQASSVLDEAFSIAVADEFERAPHAPSNPDVQAAYQQFCHEIVLQWNWISRHGLAIEPWTSTGQPYHSSSEMQADVAAGHIYFFMTRAGYGEEGDSLDQSSNPLLAQSGIVVRNEQLVANDLLRVVHDVFGHAQEGHQFGPVGEENAWLCHRTMFSAQAVKALSTETRGQNSWFNFGPHLRDENGDLHRPGDRDYLRPSERPFAPQKMTLLPTWCLAPTAGTRPCSPAASSSFVLPDLP